MIRRFRVENDSSAVASSVRARICSAACLAVLAAYGQHAAAATIDWTGATDSTWATGANWVGGVAPKSDVYTDIARFNQTSYTNQPDAGTRSVRGIQVGDGTTVTAPLTISGTQLTLGVGGINVAANASATTISSPVTLGTGQTWTNASNSALAINGAVSRGASTAGKTITFVQSGATGSITSSTLTNDSTGIIGPWASYGTAASGTSTRYATVSSGTVVGYTGTPITNTTISANMNNAAGNYDYNPGFNNSTTLAGAVAANTLRFAGSGTGTLSAPSTVTLNSVMASGGAFRFFNSGGTGAVVVGDTKELVVHTAGNAVTFGVPIWNNGSTDGTGGTASSLTVSGPGWVTLDQNNTFKFTGGITVNPGSQLTVGFNTVLSHTSMTLNQARFNLSGNAQANAFGSGPLTINGSATITRNNGSGVTFAPSSIILNGDLTVATTNATQTAGVTLGGPVTLTGNRTLNTDNSAGGSMFAGLAFAGAVGDGGSGYGLTINSATTGNSYVALNSTNTFSGPLNVNTGTLILGGSSTQNSTVVSVNSGATLAISHGQSGGAAESFAGLNDGTGGGGTVTYTGTTSVTLTLAGTGSYSFGGGITNNAGKNLSLVKSSSGTQVLGGTSTYTGSTSVNGGKLLVNGSLGSSSAVNVANNAALGGTGTVNGTVTVAAGGSLDLRDATTESLALTNSVTLGSASAASNLLFDIGTTLGTNDVLQITGTPTLNAGGVVINVNALGSSLAEGNYTLVTAAGGLGTSSFSLASNSIVVGSTTYNLSLASSTSTAEILTITAVPEPAFVGFAGMMMFGLLGKRRRG